MAFVNFIIYTILTVEIILIIYLRKEVISLFMGLFSYFMGLLSRKKEEPKSEYEEVKSYILKELNKGCAYEKISESLLRVGWKKEMIDKIISDMIVKKQN